MDIFFKYSNYRGIDDLSTIRLSSPAILNDPFEGIINSDATGEFMKTDMNLQQLHFIFGPPLIEKIKKQNLLSSISALGIVSLSETPRNLLMWAHYADEHKGICIGYKPDFLSSVVYADENGNYKNTTPLKVNYDTMRPKVIPFNESQTNINKIYDRLKKQLLIKSDEWIYEKEHRCIVPISCADYLKYDHEKDNFFDSSIFRIYLENKIIKEIELERESGEKVKAYFSEDMESTVKLLCNNRNAIFIKRVDPSKTISIHFGCKFDPKEKDRIITILEQNNHPLHHVKLYQYDISHERFELVESEAVKKNIENM
ncbi:DUF2971 domain-containing protein [Aeromonas hydrophila]